MRSTIIFSLAALLLPAVLAAPTESSPKAPVVSDLPQIDAAGLAELIADPIQSTRAAEQLPTSMLATPSPTPIAKSAKKVVPEPYLEPPPIFDPPEARPETIFDAPPGDHHDSFIKPPPLPAHRMEHLSAFDGAHAHPEVSVYQASAADSEAPSCSWQLTILKVIASITILIAAAFAVVYVGESVWTFCLRTYRGRSKSDMEAGEIRLDEETNLVEEFEKESTALAADSSVSAMWPRSRSASKANMV